MQSDDKDFSPSPLKGILNIWSSLTEVEQLQVKHLKNCLMTEDEITARMGLPAELLTQTKAAAIKANDAQLASQIKKLKSI